MSEVIESINAFNVSNTNEQENKETTTMTIETTETTETTETAETAETADTTVSIASTESTPAAPVTPVSQIIPAHIVAAEEAASIEAKKVGAPTECTATCVADLFRKPEDGGKRKGNTRAIVEWMEAYQAANLNGFLKREAIAFSKTLNDTAGAPLTKMKAEAMVNLILSPRAESERGDCRGNAAIKGHLYMTTTKRIPLMENGKQMIKYGEPATEKRYSISLRAEPMAPVKAPKVRIPRAVKEKAPKVKILSEKQIARFAKIETKFLERAAKLGYDVIKRDNQVAPIVPVAPVAVVAPVAPVAPVAVVADAVTVKAVKAVKAKKATKKVKAGKKGKTVKAAKAKVEAIKAETVAVEAAPVTTVTPVENAALVTPVAASEV